MLARRPGDSWGKVQHVAFGLESELEKLLAESPELPPHRPTNLPLLRQFFIPSITGYLDVSGVPSDGSIDLNECKLSGNPDMRRTIVGQLLAYAANLSTFTLHAFVQQLAAAAKHSKRYWSRNYLNAEDAVRDAAAASALIAAIHRAFGVPAVPAQDLT